MNSEHSSSDLADIPAVSFDLSDWTQIDLQGADASTFLHNFCTNDIHKLSPGQTSEAFVCDIKGRILSHILVLILPDRLRLIAVPGTAQILLPHLTKYLLGADVEIVDQSADLGLLCTTGPQIKEVLETTLGVPIECDLGQCLIVQTDAGELCLAGTDVVNPAAILISGERSTVEAFREQVPVELLAMGTSTLFDIARIEAGFPWCGRDIGPDDLAQSAARTTRAISFTKGCYLGQEPIARLDAMGHTNRELRGLLIPGQSASEGDVVFSGEKEQGTLSSVSYSPARSATVALAKIRTAQANPGTELIVRTADGDVPATVYWPQLD